ncbi:MAG TPA: hypothetical protein VJX91_02925 [Candidatus Eisenbacteria bacterium]|nr:hypothetical protein [Candidatus Eisenbacteria bacterium]
MQPVALDRHLAGPDFEVSRSRARRRGTPLRRRHSVLGAYREELGVPRGIRRRGADGLLGLGEDPVCLPHFPPCAVELGTTPLSLSGKSSGEGLQILRFRPQLVELGGKAFEPGELSADLLVRALELPQDSERPFGH